MAPCYDAITFNELSLQFIHHLRQEVQQPVATFASVIIYLDWANYQESGPSLPSSPQTFYTFCLCPHKRLTK